MAAPARFGPRWGRPANRWHAAAAPRGLDSIAKLLYVSKTHGQAGRYREEILGNPLMPTVCAYRHRIPDWGACKGEIQADHVIPLADAPWQKAKDVWGVPACAHHNRKKADEDAARRRDRTGDRMTETAPRPPTKGASGSGKTTTKGAAPPGKSGYDWRWIVAALVVAAWPVGSWLNAGPVIAETVGPWIPVAVAGAVVCAALGVAWKVRGWLRARAAAARADDLLRLREGIARNLPGAVPDAVVIEPRRKGAWDARGVLVRARIRYPAAVKDAEPAVRAGLEKFLREKVGQSLRFEWDTWGNFVDYAPGAPSPSTGTPGEVDAPNPTQDRAEAKLRTAMEAISKKSSKGDWSSALVRHDAIGPLEVRIHWPAEWNAASDEAQADLMRTLTISLPGRWRPVEWDGETRTLTAVRRPNMPTKVSAQALIDPTDVELVKLALGLDEDHHLAFFDVKKTPHLLVAGETGSGKTVLIRTVVTRATGKRWEVRIADPKRTEFAGFRGWPGVGVVATRIEAIIALVTITHAEMDQRNEQIEMSASPFWRGRKITPSDFNPILLVIDEAREFIDRANALWRALPGSKGTEHPVVELFRSIARLGRTARIHLVTGIQRPDAKVFGGEARDNYGGRASLGSLSQDGARMMYGNAAIGRDVPDDIKGRATVDLGSGPQEIQVAWTPDPGDRDGDNTPEDWAILAELRRIAEEAWQGIDLSGVADAVDEWVEAWERQQNGGDGDGSGTSRGRGRQRPSQPRGGATVATPPPDRTRRQPAPEPRARPETAVLPFLNTCAIMGDPQWVIDEGEAVQVVNVGDERDADDNVEVTFRDAKRNERSVWMSDDTVFELADPPQ